MFNSKLENLNGFTTSVSQAPKSKFIQAGLKNAAETVSGNGSKKFKNLDCPFTTQFAQAGQYKTPRSFEEISKDMSELWAIDPLLTVKFATYLRIITRKTVDFKGATTQDSQAGGELKHEAIMRYLWILTKSPETFYENLPIFVAVGSWRDIFEMMRYDLIHHDWDNKILDFNRMAALVLSGLNSTTQINLVKKYLPKIKSNKQATTVRSQANVKIAKFLCNKLFGETDNQGRTYRQYRKLKSSGTAHSWQQLISQGKHDLVDFDTIHGRALMLMSRSKYLQNQNLTEKYAKWIEDPNSDVKMTGFVHELFAPLAGYFNQSVNLPTHQEETINRQFTTLVEKGGESEQTKFIVVRDTSSSMSSPANGANMSCFNVTKALALYFSEFLEGPFANAFYEFDGNATLHQWKGSTPVEKWKNDSCEAYGDTEFQSIFRDIARIKQSGVEESEFPTGILCLSDGMFNRCDLDQTNVESARNILRQAGFSEEFCSEFKIVLWNLSNNFYGRSSKESQFETHNAEVPNVYYFSGFNGATVKFLTGKIRNASELFHAAMNQEILEKVEIYE